jgi:serine/threonine protein phosphatase PrpC
MTAERTLETQLAVSCASLSELGGRSSNQDRLGLAEQDELACFVVSDGVGGQCGGEIASQTVVSAIIDRFLEESLYGERALRSYFDHATAEVAARKRGEPEFKDMSATVAVVLIDRINRSALLAHLGDTRIYLFRDRRLHHVSKDHSLVQQFIDAGYCTPSQLRTHPLRSTLFAAVGIESETPVEPITPAMTLEAGDAVLICTDGFWEWLPEEAMERAFDGATDVQGWLDGMAAVAAGGSLASGKERDNATAIAIWIGQPVQVA